MNLTKVRQQLTQNIKRIIKPKLRDSGFVRTNDKPLQLCVFYKGDQIEALPISCLSLTDFSGMRVDSIIGFTKQGVITDDYAVAQPWHEICIEDLATVHDLLQKHQNNLK
jgi:hypothetical protein